MAGSTVQVMTGLSVPYRTQVTFLLTCLVIAAAAELQVYKTETCPRNDKGLHDKLRILLVGKAGAGKSATGNTILGKSAFVTDFSSSSVTTQCNQVHGNVNGRQVVVIDSPGLFNPNLSPDESVSQVKLCIPLSSPGPHAFLFVLRLGTFTDEEEETVKLFQLIFGEESLMYTIIIFTHGDQLKDKNIHQFVRDSPKLVNLLKKCSGRYHVFNNVRDDPEQVIQLLDQIDKMVTGNGGEHYTSEMLQEIERAIVEETLRILKEKEDRSSHLLGYTTEIQTWQLEDEELARWKAIHSISVSERISEYLRGIYNEIYKSVESFYFSCRQSWTVFAEFLSSQWNSYSTPKKPKNELQKRKTTHMSF